MAFGTWPAAAIVPASGITTGIGAVASIDASDRMVVSGRSALDLYKTISLQGAQLSAALSQASLDDNTGAEGSTGVLVTAAPGANQHGIPANFGPGRGLWTGAHITRLSVFILANGARSFEAAPPLNAIPDIKLVQITLAAGNITLVFKNYTHLTATTVQIWLKHDHSISL